MYIRIANFQKPYPGNHRICAYLDCHLKKITQETIGYACSLKKVHQEIIGYAQSGCQFKKI